MRQPIVRTCALALLLALVAPGCATRGRKILVDDNIARLKRDIEKVQFAVGSTKRLMARARGKQYLAGLYYRLAELYIEQARYFYLIALERQKLAAKKKGVPASSAVVSVQTRMLKNLAISTFKRLLALFPDYEDAPKVRFFIGHELRELGDYEKMISTYEELIEKHPGSNYRLEALLVLGDHFFDKANLDAAERYYARVLTGKESHVHAMARYKLAWCKLNRGDCAGALKLFEAAVDAATRLGGTSTDSQGKQINLQREALVDLVYCYTDKRKWENSIQYFRARGQSKPIYLAALRKLANRYYIKQKWPASALIHRELLRLEPSAEDAVEYGERLYDSLVKGKLFTNADSDVLALLTVVRLLPQNLALSSSDRKKIGAAYEKYTRFLATQAHEQANRSRERDELLRAAAAYRAYLRAFGDHEKADLIRGNLAEVNYATGKYLDAAAGYEAISRRQKGKEREDSIYTAVVAYDKALRSPKDLSRLDTVLARSGLRRAGRRYLRLFPRAAKGKEIKFNIARTFFDAGDFEEAIPLLKAFVEEFTQQRDATVAAHLVLDAYRTMDDFRGLIAAGKAFGKTRGLGDATFRSEVAAIVKGAENQLLSSETIKAGTGRGGDLEAIARKYKGTALGGAALVNAFVAADNARDAPKMFSIGEQIIENYPANKEAPKILSAMAKIAMDTFQFERGAKYLEQSGKRQRGADAATVYLAAAEVRAGLGQRDRARRDLAQALAAGAGANAADTAVKVVELDLDARDWNAAQQTLGRLATAGVSNGTLDYFAGYAALRSGDLAQAASKLQSAAASGDKTARAAAQYYLAEASFSAFQQQGLATDLAQLGASLQRKLGLMEQVKAQFAKAASVGDATWTVAALNRLSVVAGEGARSLEEAQLPGSVPPAVQQQIRTALNRSAGQMRSEAKEALKQCVKVVRKLQVMSAAAKACLKSKTTDVDPQKRKLAKDLSSDTPPDVADLRKQLAKNPGRVDLITRLARAYLAVKNAHAARVVASKGLENKPNSAKLLNILGVASAMLGDPQAALENFSKALTSEPNYDFARANKARVLKRYGYKKEAAAERKRLSNPSISRDEPEVL
ncbi:MAG: tetratricopeptide repeat protein [Deltaproteobacteria bacterium]|nr:tetratricopeptide repeat protein [Deltaproteobacteria bacterium]